MNVSYTTRMRYVYQKIATYYTKRHKLDSLVLTIKYKKLSYRKQTVRLLHNIEIRVLHYKAL